MTILKTAARETRAGRVKLFHRQRTIGVFSLLGTVTDVSLLTLHSGVTEVSYLSIQRLIVSSRNPINRKIATTI